VYTFTDPSEVKLIIMYIIRNFSEAIDNGQITDIFMDYEFVDYFTMQKYLDELVEMRLVEVDRHSGLRLYFLTAHGQEAYDAYMKKIPVSVREKLLLSIRAYKKKERSEADISATYRPLNELSYAADLSIRESGFPLLDIHMSVGGKETAREVCRRFRENPQKTYAALLEILTGHEEVHETE